MPNEELELLKQRAKMMGISFKNNIGVQALKKKMEAHKEEPVADDEADDVVDVTEDDEAQLVEGLSPAKLAAISKQARSLKMRRLVRIRLSSNNPAHQKHQGYLANVGNRELGQFKKFIPFDTEWHIPYFVFQNLQNERFFQAFVEKRSPSTGRKSKKSVIRKEFVVEELNPLTDTQLKALAATQQASLSIDGSED